MRRGTQHLSSVFGYCEKLGQVVSIHREPQPISPIPNEKKALERDAVRKSQIEQERARFGLEPGTVSDLVTGIDELSLEDGKEPESVYASQFAKMAAFMEGILAEKKSKQVPSSPYDAVRPCSRLQDVPSEKGPASARRNFGLESTRWNIAGESPSSTIDRSEEIQHNHEPLKQSTRPTRHTQSDQLGAQSQQLVTSTSAQAMQSVMARPLAERQPSQRNLQPRPSATEMNRQIYGTKAEKEDGPNILPSGQQWW